MAGYYQEFLIIAGSALSDELVKFLKTRHFDWITLQNLVLFAEIVQTTFSRYDLQIQNEITQCILKSHCLNQCRADKSHKASCHPFNKEASIFASKSFLLPPSTLFPCLPLTSVSRQKFPRASGFRILSGCCVRPRTGLVTCLHPFWRACEHTAGRRTRTAPGRLSGVSAGGK